MPKHFGPARTRVTSFAAVFALCPVLFAQGHGGGGYAGGGHSSPLSYGAPFHGGGNMGTPLGGHYGSIGPAVVPPIANSGRGYGNPGRVSYNHGNRPFNPGYGHGRYPPGYIPYYVAAYPYLYFGGNDYPNTGEAYGPPPQPDQSNDLMMELDGIHHELAELQQRQAQQPYGMAPAEAGPMVVEQAPSKPLDPPLLLVFRDGTQTEVRDFAVVGQMFWDLSVHPTRKFPISQLNLDASIKANEDRGVDFPSVAKAK